MISLAVVCVHQRRAMLQVEAEGVHQLRAEKDVARSDVQKTLVSSNKGAIGHLLGAAGAVESAFTVLSLYHVSAELFSSTDQLTAHPDLRMPAMLSRQANVTLELRDVALSVALKYTLFSQCPARETISYTHTLTSKHPDAYNTDITYTHAPSPSHPRLERTLAFVRMH